MLTFKKKKVLKFHMIPLYDDSLIWKSDFLSKKLIKFGIIYAKNYISKLFPYFPNGTNKLKEQKKLPINSWLQALKVNKILMQGEMKKETNWNLSKRRE